MNRRSIPVARVKRGAPAPAQTEVHLVKFHVVAGPPGVRKGTIYMEPMSPRKEARRER